MVWPWSVLGAAAALQAVRAGGALSVAWLTEGGRCGVPAVAQPFAGLLNIGPFEILLLLAAAVLLFGGDLPAVARKAGQTLYRLRRAAQDLTRQFSIDDETEPGIGPPAHPHPTDVRRAERERRRAAERRAASAGEPDEPDANAWDPPDEHEAPEVVRGDGEPTSGGDGAGPDETPRPAGRGDGALDDGEGDPPAAGGEAAHRGDRPAP